MNKLNKLVVILLAGLLLVGAVSSAYARVPPGDYCSKRLCR